MRQFYFHQHEKYSKGGTFMLQGATLLKPNWHQSNCVSILSEVLHLIRRPNIIVLNLSLFPHCRSLQCHAQSYCTVLTSSLMARAPTNLHEPACIQGHVNLSCRIFLPRLLVWWGRKTLKPLENWYWIASSSLHVSFWLSPFFNWSFTDFLANSHSFYCWVFICYIQVEI